MDEHSFLRFLKKNGKSARAIQGYLDSARRFEAFLEERGKNFETASPLDLHTFVDFSASRGVGVTFLAISTCYEWLGSESPVRWEAHALFSAITFPDFKLSQYMGISPEHVKAFRKAGIVTAPQMLVAGKTPALREELARKTGVPLDCILELVKLSDLGRIGGIKRIRGRLYYDGGFDTLDKLAASDSAEVRRKLDEYIRRTGFEGVIPTPKEADHAVHMARHLQRVIEY